MSVVWVVGAVGWAIVGVAAVINGEVQTAALSFIVAILAQNRSESLGRE